MVLKAKSKFLKNRNSWTYYLAIPADVVKDSQFPFKPDEEVDLKIKTDDQTLVISGTNYQIRQNIGKFHEKLKSDQKKSNKKPE